jgi:DGQHR domain-containing protein
MNKRESLVKELPAIRVNQWLPEWSSVHWDKKEHRSEPKRWFYQFSISASHLKALSGIYARTTRERSRSADDLGIQRRHESERSSEIARFVEYGYPWSDLSAKKRASPEFHDLRKPGWLPTAIVVNVLSGSDIRRGRKVHPDDLIEITTEKNGQINVKLPDGFTGRNWRPKQLPPIEVIDGQHRLWAFEEAKLPDDFELPVVAFEGLDISWQAYLFYTINIKPKKINASLAFDLYPLLRTEDWLSKFEGHVIYRETRAQEITDLLWSHPISPWHKRINMLGEPGHKGLMVSQAAWIRSLLATFIRRREGKGKRIGGLFGAPVGANDQTPSWNRAEQTALLIYLGNQVKASIRACTEDWATVLRKQPRTDKNQAQVDWAFYGPNTLLNQDQGIRVLLHVLNDFLYLKADELALTNWGGSSADGAGEDDVTAALQSLEKQSDLKKFVDTLTKALSTYDWRASDAPELTEAQSLLKAAFRGSGGYGELRRHLLKHLTKGPKDIAECSREVLIAIGD